jgi:hypothetical protein
MTDHHTHSIIITSENAALSELKLSWNTAVFTTEDGIGSLDSLHRQGMQWWPSQDG